MCIVTWLKNPTPNDEACDSLRSNTRRFSAFRSFISPVLSFTRHLEDSETKDSLAQDSTRVWCWDGGSFSDVSLPLFAYFSTFHNVQGWRLQIRVLPLKVETNLCYTDCHFTCLTKYTWTNGTSVPRDAVSLWIIYRTPSYLIPLQNSVRTTRILLQ